MACEIPRWRPPRPRTRRANEVAHYHTHDWRAKRLRILRRDALTCRLCGIVTGTSGHVDHIVPLEDGGADVDANLQTLCGACHGRKTRAEQRRKGFMSR